jgi:hypothetical protein
MDIHFNNIIDYYSVNSIAFNQIIIAAIAYIAIMIVIMIRGYYDDVSESSALLYKTMLDAIEDEDEDITDDNIDDNKNENSIQDHKETNKKTL